MTPELTKITITNRANLDPLSNFFSTGEARKIVLCSLQAGELARARLGMVAEIIPVESRAPAGIVAALEKVAIRKLFVEGGTSVLTAFISAGYFRKLRVAVAPFFCW